jgi:hypothetical protein
MATTLQARVEDLIGTVSDSDALYDALTVGSRFIIDMMPEEVLEENSAETTVTTSGLDITNARVHYAHKNGYGARKVPARFRALVQDSSSIYYAVPTDPVQVVYGGKIYVYPSGGSVYKIDYPTIASGAATNITGLQSKLIQPVIYYASIQLLFHAVNAIYDEITTLEAAIPDAPDVDTNVADPSFTDTTIAATLTSESLPTSPEYGGTIDSGLPEFDGSFTELATALDTEEDIDLAQAHMNRITQYLGKYRADMENELNEFREELEIYNRAYELKYKMAEALLTVAIKNQDYILQKELAEFKSLLDKNMALVQSYATEVSAWSGQVKTKLEVMASKFNLMKELQAQLKILLEVHLGVR